MTDPLSFPETTPRHALPMLYAGQAQKVVTVNEALAATDLLLHPAVSGERPDPPAAPVEGEMWLVAAGATGDWTGRDGALAGWTGGGWRFVAPRTGLRIFDIAAAAFRIFDGAWTAPPAAPPAPLDGTTVDAEARLAIAQIITRLCDVRIFSTT